MPMQVNVGEAKIRLSELPTRVEAGEAGLVPILFWHKVRNVLLTAERRGRIEPNHVDETLSWLRELPLTMDPGDDDVRVLALALAKGYPLASLYVALSRAARNEGAEMVVK